MAEAAQPEAMMGDTVEGFMAGGEMQNGAGAAMQMQQQQQTSIGFGQPQPAAVDMEA